MRLLRKIKPNFLSIYFFLFFLILSGMGSTYEESFSSPENSITTHEITLGIKKIESGRARTVSYDINWLLFIPNVVMIYLLSLVASTTLAKLTELKRPQRAYFIYFLFLLSFLSAASYCLSYYRWGYGFSRPNTPNALSRIDKVIALSDIKTIRGDGPRRFESSSKTDIAKQVDKRAKDSYYGLEGRILEELVEQQKLSTEKNYPEVDITGLRELLFKLEVFENSEKGYHSNDYLYGFVIEAISVDETTLRIIGLGGQQVSNDHFPWYEIVLESKDNKAWAFKDRVRFFYDVAGYEGFEGIGLLFILLVYFLFIGLLLFPILVGVASKLSLKN